ncbi:MAG TPA: tail fiber domain-containing protein [Candidatus Saccharimonadales bacterium]|nr:tail fiber domain-containing protein [Candidatus Saccharimonadales bacterium]
MTKRLWKISVLALLAIFLVAGLRLPAANASNPTTISFQGKVVNANGTNVSDGTYTFVFRLYSVSSGGSAVWTETDSLSVAAGVFQVNLGANCPFFTANACNSSTPLNFSTSNSLYLGITFNSDPAGEMSPRVQLQSVPYSFYADSAGNATNLGGRAASGYVQLSPNSAQTGFINLAGGDTLINNTGSNNTSIGGSSGTLNLGGASSGIITLQSGAAINVTAGAASTWNFGSNTLGITSSKLTIDTSGNTTLGGTLDVQGTGNSTISGTLTFNGAGGALANLIDLGANIPATGQNLLVYHGGNFRTGLGIQTNVFRLFTSTGAIFSFGHVSTSDGTTYTENARIDANGNLEVGTTAAASARVVIAGADATSSNFALNVTNSTPNSILSVRDDGQITIGTFTTGVVHSSAAGVLSSSAVVLGTDTSGSYVANLGTLTGLSTSGNSGAGSTPTLSVQYGSAANTAVQGNVTFACPSAGSNLSGGGNTITEGTGGTCTALAVVNNPTFSGLVTANGGLTVVGATNINASGTAATNIGTGSSGAVSIGSGSNTFALNSTGLDISTAGAISGATSITASGTITGATINATSNFQANGTPGDNVTCTGTQYLSAPEVNKGLVTGDGGCRSVGLSDQRLKTNITSLSSNTLDTLAQVNPVNFYFDCGNAYFAQSNTACDTNLQTGVIAQQLQQFLPQLVSADEWGYLHVDYQGLSVEVLKGVSELAKHIDSAGNADFATILAPSLTSSGALSIDSGSVGNVSIDTGSPATINIGTDRAAAVSLSRAGQTTTVNGGLRVDQTGDFSGDVNVGGSLKLNGAFNLVGPTGATVISFDNSGNANFNGNLNLASASLSGGLTVGGDLNVAGLSTFQKLATFLAKTIFRQDVEFDGHITVASDTAGYASLRTGESTVHVTFTKPYDNPPVVTVNIVDGQFGLSAVNNITNQGFDISLSVPAAAPTTLSWMAIGVNSPQTATNPPPGN